ncbi:SIR2 family protein [Oscillospiraceae bacterium OttesenSCG-928-G22]|nr:SIR2 family protein [Oscillospiraceae bacterium OttesenSCG-928-G22]
MADSPIVNIIKVREDGSPFTLTQLERGGVFSTESEQISSSWLQTGKESDISLSDLRNGIEPWLTSLFQSEHLSLLTGTGLSIAVQYLASNSANSAMGEPVLNTEYADRIRVKSQNIAERSSRGKANIEDYIRVINELLRGLEVLGYDSEDGTESRATYDKLSENLLKIIQEFANSISGIENSIAIAGGEQRQEAFDYLVSFLMSFASRIGTRERLNIFTTNYDRLIEAGAEIAGLHLLDRFVGSLAPIFRSSRLDIDMHYNPPGIRGEPRYLEGVARFTKLHGSIDWINTGEDIRKIGLPFGSEDIENFLNSPGLDGADVGKMMIYPNAAKDRETTEYPYVELFRDFSAALCRPNSTLVTYGYGFGDDHINRIIRDMLTIPSTHLVIISYDDVDGRIMKKFAEFGRSSQISLIIGNGLADLKTLVDYFLPKPSIDRTSIRMNDLLKQRYSTPKTDLSASTDGGGSTL